MVQKQRLAHRERAFPGAVKREGRERVARFPVSDDPADFGPQDCVICALKAHQANQAADQFAPLFGDETSVVTAMNGIPWWYFYKETGPFEGRRMESVDPGNRQWDLIGPERAIGCVVDPACEVIAPGVIEHHEYKRFILGEPDNRRSPRVMEISQVLTYAGFDAPVREGIRWNIWLNTLTD